MGLATVLYRRCLQILFVATLLLGLSVWRPGYRPWGMMTAGLLGVLAFWLCERIVWRHGRLPGQSLHYALLGLGACLAGHVLIDQGWFGNEPSRGGGGLDLSLMVVVGLMSLGVLLCQSLFAAAKIRAWVQPILGGAMLAAGLTQLWFAPENPARGAMTLLAGAGALVWLVACPGWLRNRGRANLVWLLPVAGGLGWMLPAAHFGLSAAPAGVTILVCMFLGMWSPREKNQRLVAWLFGTLACVGAYVPLIARNPLLQSSFGLGERGFAHVTAADSGLEVLLAVTGYVGVVGLLTLAFAGAFRMLLWHHREENGFRDRLRAGAATAAALLMLQAWLSEGGLTHPAVFAGLVAAWGLLPYATRCTVRPRGNWRLAIAVVAALVVVAVANDSGCLLRMALVYGVSDKGLHGMTGFVTGLVLAWWLGCRRWWAGLLGLAAAAVAGFGGEFAQKLFTHRTYEIKDFSAHFVGVLASAGLYGLCRLAKPASDFRKRKPWRPPHFFGQVRRLCQFVLLGIVLVMLPAWLIVAFKVAGEVWAGPKPEFEVSDAVVAIPRERAVYLPGMSNFVTPGSFGALYNASRHGRIEGSWASLKTGKPRIMPKLSGVITGKDHILTSGWPLGSLGWVSQEVLLVGVSSSSTVVVMDADLLQSVEGKPEDWAGPLLRTLQSIGQPMVLFPEPSPYYASFRQWAHRQTQPVPVFCEVAHPDSHFMPYVSMAHLLRGAQSPLPRVTYITARIDRARLARRYYGSRCSLWMIGEADAAGGSISAPTRRFPSIQALRVSVSSRHGLRGETAQRPAVGEP